MKVNESIAHDSREFVSESKHNKVHSLEESRKVSRVGEKKIANNGIMMEIIAYRNANDIDVRFQDGTVVLNKSYAAFHKGSIAKKKSELDCITDDLYAFCKTFYDDGAKVSKISITFADNFEFLVTTDKIMLYVNSYMHIVDTIASDENFEMKRVPHKLSVLGKLYRSIIKYTNSRKIEPTKITLCREKELTTESGMKICSEKDNYVTGEIELYFQTGIYEAE